VNTQTLIVERDGAVMLIRLNRPSRLNAINGVMLDELQAVCDAIEADDGVRAVVLTGDDRAFSAGFDLQDQAASPPQGSQWEPVLRRDFDTIMRFWTLSKPTIAAVRGAALAGGCELALACDLTIAAENARFGEPELKFGAGIVVMLVPWMTGPKQAKEILLTGLDDIDAAEAHRLGLVNRVVPTAKTLEVALGIARRLAVVDPRVVRRTKAAINETYRIMGMETALEAALAADVLLEGEGSEDKRAFLAVLREQGLKGALAWRDARFDVS